MRTKRADSVIFDFDGVIADTIEDVWASVEYASEIVGGIMDRDFMKDTSHVALPEEELLRHVRPYPGKTGSILQRCQNPLQDHESL